jgi:hypothetical protein
MGGRLSTGARAARELLGGLSASQVQFAWASPGCRQSMTVITHDGGGDNYRIVRQHQQLAPAPAAREAPAFAFETECTFCGRARKSTQSKWGECLCEACLEVLQHWPTLDEEDLARMPNRAARVRAFHFVNAQRKQSNGKVRGKIGKPGVQRRSAARSARLKPLLRKSAMRELGIEVSHME